MAKKRNPLPPGLGQGTGYYTKEIVKCLEQVYSVSGQRPYAIFNDFLQIVEVTLDALPEQLKAVAQTGQFAQDPPETTEVFNQVRARYESPHSPAAHRRVWEAFSQAFALLLESAEPGLWGEDGYGRFDCGYMGPDVLGHVYTIYANAGQAKWNMQIFTPWNVALMMGRFLVPQGERQVYDRVKQACQHPDNILAQATLLAGLAIDDPAQAREWFFNRVLPAALPYYEPITVGDPAGCGSGVLLLAAAACFPEWAVRLGYVVFQGIDNDPQCVRLAKINCMLYGLNGYACHLTHSFAASAAVCFQKSIQEQGFSQSHPSLKAKFPLEKPDFGKIIS